MLDRIYTSVIDKLPKEKAVEHIRWMFNEYGSNIIIDIEPDINAETYCYLKQNLPDRIIQPSTLRVEGYPYTFPYTEIGPIVLQ